MNAPRTCWQPWGRWRHRSESRRRRHSVSRAETRRCCWSPEWRHYEAAPDPRRDKPRTVPRSESAILSTHSIPARAWSTHNSHQSTHSRASLSPPHCSCYQYRLLTITTLLIDSSLLPSVHETVKWVFEWITVAIVGVDDSSIQSIGLAWGPVTTWHSSAFISYMNPMNCCNVTLLLAKCLSSLISLYNLFVVKNSALSSPM